MKNAYHLSMYLRSARAVILVCLLLLTACGAQTAAPATTTPESLAVEIANVMIVNGAPLRNIRDVPRTAQRAQKITESKGFDIPNVDLEGKPAGVIHIFKDPEQAKFEAGLPSLLGGSGKESKQPFTAANGKVELELDYRLEPKLAEVYLNAFRAVAINE